MASPLALSVAALIWSQNPLWTAEHVKQRLFDSADDIEGLSCNASYINKLGAGRVNAYNAVTLPSCAGDLDGDGDVDGQDWSRILTAFEAGLADENDLDLFASEFGRSDCLLR